MRNYHTTLRRLIISLMTASVCLLLCNTSLFAWTENWESIRETASQIDSISSEFVQEKHLPMLKRPLESKGVLYFQKPDALRWEYRTPIASILMSYRGEVVRYLKQGNAFTKDVGSGVQAMQVVLNEITHWLGGRFDQSQNFTASLKKGGLVVLEPKNDQLKKMIARIELVLSKQPGLIESVTIFENQNSFTRLLFISPKLNETIDSALFQKP